MELQALFVPDLVPELIEAGARVHIEKEGKKKSNDDLQQNYLRCNNI